MKLRGDNPIQHADDDAYGRLPQVKSFVKTVLSLDVSEGAVVGVLGPWGSGKTSFTNLARDPLKDSGMEVLDFNPWMFSGAEQLVRSFFVELAAQLKQRRDLEGIADALRDYGDVLSGLGWIPVVGASIARVAIVARALGGLLKRQRNGVEERRKELCEALASLEKPICVVLDDIDRLSTSEIRDVFKLVRLTASFPNIIYIVAFDRLRVEEALKEDCVSGRDYIEKILLLVVDLPCVQAEALLSQLLGAMGEVVAGIGDSGPLDQSVWLDVFAEVVRPLVRNMRDVRRYVAGLHWTLASLAGQISLVDLMALEAIRIFLPDVFRQLHGAVDALTLTTDDIRGIRTEADRLKARVESLMEAAEGAEGVVNALVERLFPAAKQHLGTGNYGSDWKSSWLKEKRVAHADYLRLYLEHTAAEGLRARWEAETAFDLLESRDELDNFLRSIEEDRRVDVIAALEGFEDQFRATQVVPAAIVLLNLIEDLPDRRRGLGDFGSRIVVVRVVLRLLRCLEDEAAIEAAARKALPELRSLSAKLELVRTVGHEKNVGLRLLSPDTAADLERQWRDEVRQASAEELAVESDAATILLVARKQSSDDEGPVDVPNDPHVTAAILRDVRSEAIGQTIGSRAITREARLAWGALLDLYGDEATVRKRVEDLKRANLPETDEVIQLAVKYIEGWRPDD